MIRKFNIVDLLGLQTKGDLDFKEKQVISLTDCSKILTTSIETIKPE